MTETVEGDLPFFEGTRRGKLVNRRVLGPWRFAGLAAPVSMFLCILVFGLAANAAPHIRDYPYAAAAFPVFVVVTIAVGFATRRFVVARIRGRWHDRGTPRQIHLNYRVADEGFQIESQAGFAQLAWPYVSELALEKGWWLLIAAGGGYFIPRSLFAGPEQERAFVAAVLARLQPVALARSRQAKAFATGSNP